MGIKPFFTTNVRKVCDGTVTFYASCHRVRKQAKFRGDMTWMDLIGTSSADPTAVLFILHSSISKMHYSKVVKVRCKTLVTTYEFGYLVDLKHARSSLISIWYYRSGNRRHRFLIRPIAS